MILVFTKAHVAGYTRGDGVYVAPHYDRRPDAQPELPFGRPETGGDQVIVFPYASGMSRKRDMNAAVESAAGVGTVIQEISRPGMQLVADAIAAGKPFFVDSGAFPAFRMAMKQGKPEQARLDFDKVFDRYGELADLVKERVAAEHAGPMRALHRGLLMLVAPDIIGDQLGTLELLEKHKAKVHAWIDAGFEVIVPFQRGPLPQSEVFKRVHKLIGAGFVVGIPSAAAALDNDDLRELLSQPYKPDRIHILGAVQSKAMAERMAVIRECYVRDVPGVTADANVMRSKLSEVYGLTGDAKFEKIKDILNRVTPDIWGGMVPTMFKSFPVMVRYPDAGEPTPAQIKSGRYPKGRLDWNGLVIAIENPAGSVRRGVASDGTPWETPILFDYGYVRRSMGVDGDEVDVYAGLHLDAPMVFVVHQRTYGDWERFDEDKCMLGFLSEEDARQAYLACYDDPRFLGPITPMPVAEFVAKVKATREAPSMIKGLTAFAKAHVRDYTRKDGVVVAAHEDRRPAARRRVRDEPPAHNIYADMGGTPAPEPEQAPYWDPATQPPKSWVDPNGNWWFDPFAKVFRPKVGGVSRKPREQTPKEAGAAAAAEPPVVHDAPPRFTRPSEPLLDQALVLFRPPSA
jgi:hypothetical protein